MCTRCSCATGKRTTTRTAPRPRTCRTPVAPATSSGSRCTRSASPPTTASACSAISWTSSRPAARRTPTSPAIARSSSACASSTPSDSARAGSRPGITPGLLQPGWTYPTAARRRCREGPDLLPAHGAGSTAFADAVPDRRPGQGRSTAHGPRTRVAGPRQARQHRDLLRGRTAVRGVPRELPSGAPGRHRDARRPPPGPAPRADVLHARDSGRASRSAACAARPRHPGTWQPRTWDATCWSWCRITIIRC